MDDVRQREVDRRDLRAERCEVNRLVERIRALEAENRNLRLDLVHALLTTSPR
jgi:cell shape-determining protein MreC